jgi:hypothetical protein
MLQILDRKEIKKEIIYLNEELDIHNLHDLEQIAGLLGCWSGEDIITIQYERNLEIYGIIYYGLKVKYLKNSDDE